MMFTIILKNDKLTSYNRLGLFILLIHALYFTGYFLKVNSNVNFIALIGGIAVAFIAFLLNIASASKNNKPVIPFAVVLIILAIIWAALENYWLFAAMLVLAFLDFNVRKKPVVNFFDDRIELNAFPKRTYQWEQMANVILKDRILTLDFKDDRLMQPEIDEESWKVEEEAFNLFSQQHLVNKE